jgi:hypothetical protein
MLSQKEQDVVDNYFMPGFGAYLQWAFSEYPDLRETIVTGKYPDQPRLRECHKEMNRKRVHFDLYYSADHLPSVDANPLRLEQDAWKLLSPKVKQHLVEFDGFIEDYSPQNADGEQLLAHVDCGWDLLQDWNVISQSYKAKRERVWDKVAEREDKIMELIRKLSTD